MTATGGLSGLYKTWEEPLEPGQATDPADVDDPTWPPAPRAATDLTTHPGTRVPLVHGQLPRAASPEPANQAPDEPPPPLIGPPTGQPAIGGSSNDSDDRSYLTRALSENAHRKDLTPLAEARALATLRDDGMSQRQIAARTGISQAQISKRLQLLGLPIEVQDAIEAGTITVTDALTQLRAVSESDQRAAVEAVRSGASSSVEGAIQHQEPAAKPQQVAAPEPPSRPTPHPRASTPPTDMDEEVTASATEVPPAADETGDTCGSQPQQQPGQAPTVPVGNIRSEGAATADQPTEPTHSSDLAVAVSSLPRAEPSEPAPAPFRATPTGLTDTSVVHARQLERRRQPTTGFRSWAYRASRGRVNLGKTTAELVHAELLSRITRPLHTGLGAHHIAIASLKGGVGKTTVGACLGLTLAETRTDRVASVDINLHAGTLHDRLIGTEIPTATIQHLLDNLDEIESINDIDRYQTTAGRLAVFAGDNDPSAGEAFAGDDYDSLIDVLNRFYNIILADCGTGLAEPAMRATLSHTDSLVVVTTPTIDAASRASYTLDWLAHVGYGDLVDSAIVVLSHDHTSADVDIDALRAHLANTCAHVVEVPFDDHLSAGGHIDLEAASSPTRQAYLQLAALVADNL